ncbi:hypothetical protein LTR12_018154 [Friedmanniomyces endolithicus]|nr:hypothetical protein LTR12_018154 [Friedmanniomyces endolithicus]
MWMYLIPPSDEGGYLREMSSEVEVTGRTRAFDPHKDAGSLKAYFRVAQQILVYFDRVAASEDYFFSHEPDEECVLLEDTLEPTDEQLAVWGAIRRLAQEEATSESGDDDHRLRDRLLDFWMLLISHETGSRRARKEQRGEGRTLELVKRCCERYLQQTVEAPIGEILRWRLLLFRVSKDSVGDHEASWDEDEQVLTYADTELHMHQIPTLLLSEYRLCQQLLHDDLMLGQKDVRYMESRTLRDGPDVDTVGWDFTQHRDNAHLLQDLDRALLAAIERSQPLCQHT